MAGAAGVAAVIAAGVLTVWGAGAGGTNFALMVTARWSFLLFWLAYAGGGLAVLSSGARPIAAHGRELGLSFAAAHLIHISLVAWLVWIGKPPNREVFVFFVPPLIVLYLIALASIPALFRKLPHWAWAILRTGGMSYILYAFAADFLNEPFNLNPRHVVFYALFALMCVVAPPLHLLWLISPLWQTKRAAR